MPNLFILVTTVRFFHFFHRRKDQQDIWPIKQDSLLIFDNNYVIIKNNQLFPLQQLVAPWRQTRTKKLVRRSLHFNSFDFSGINLRPQTHWCFQQSKDDGLTVLSAVICFETVQLNYLPEWLKPVSFYVCYGFYISWT